MTIEKMSILQEALARKKCQELLRREHRQKQALLDIKEIFLDTFSLPTPDETKPLIKKLTNIVEKVSDTNLDTNAKLLECSKNKFQSKVNEKISCDIAFTQVALETKVESVKKVLEKIFSLYTKLCNPTLLTQETRTHILILESQINSSSATFPMTLAQSEKHFRTLLQTQSQLATLSIDEANIRAKLKGIQIALTPHMEIFHKELGYVETLMKKDPNLSTLVGLVHLAVELAI